MSNTKEAPDNIVEFLRQLHDRCLELSQHLVFDKRHVLHFGLISLYGSLIELAGCILTLMKNQGKLGVPTLFRTFLETYVEFHNLVLDPTYGYIIEANDLKEELNMLRAARDTRSPYLLSIADLPDLATIIANREKELDRLKVKGYKPISIYLRFERAGMVDQFRSIYKLISTEAHSNKRALISRHAEIKEDGTDYEMTYYKNSPDERYSMYTISAADLLVDATFKIHDHFKSDVLDEAKTFKLQLDDICAQYRSRYLQ